MKGIILAMLSGFGIALAGAGVLVLTCLAGAFFGGVGGYIFALVFDDSFAVFVEWGGIPTTSGFEVGAVLGFLGGFFKSTQTNTVKSS